MATKKKTTVASVVAAEKAAAKAAKKAATPKTTTTTKKTTMTAKAGSANVKPASASTNKKMLNTNKPLMTASNMGSGVPKNAGGAVTTYVGAQGAKQKAIENQLNAQAKKTSTTAKSSTTKKATKTATVSPTITAPTKNTAASEDNALRNTYNSYYTQEQKRQQDAYNQQVKANNADANARVRAAYLNSQRNQYALNDQLARQGVTGGASETARMNLMNQYAGQANAYRNAATNANTSAYNNMQNSLSAYKISNQQALNNALQQAQSRRDNLTAQAWNQRFAEQQRQDALAAQAWNQAYAEQQRKDTQATQKYNQQVAEQNVAEQRFANTVQGYSNNNQIQRLINQIQKSGKDTWKIPYLRAQMSRNSWIAKGIVTPSW